MAFFSLPPWRLWASFVENLFPSRRSRHYPAQGQRPFKPLLQPFQGDL